MTRPVLCAALMAAFFVSPSYGQDCGNRADVIEYLAKEYGEAKVGGGLGFHGAVTEIYANPETGTWTIADVRPDGLMCLVMAGEGWRSAEYVAPVVGDPT